MGEFLRYLQDEWAVIGKAPLIFALAIVLAGGVIWLVVSRLNAVQLANKQSELDLAKARNDDYELKLKGASPTEAAKLIAGLERRLAALEPLTLIDQQLEALWVLLRSMPNSIEIAHDSHFPDAVRAAGQLVAVFRKSGWRVNEKLYDGKSWGSGIVIVSRGDPNQTSIGLQQAFTEVGIRTMHATDAYDPALPELRLLVLRPVL